MYKFCEKCNKEEDFGHFLDDSDSYQYLCDKCFDEHLDDCVANLVSEGYFEEVLTKDGKIILKATKKAI